MDDVTAQEGMRHTVEGVADQGKVEFAREQRREPTPGESTVWQALRRKQLGVKFRRQHPIDLFVLDFYCAEARLAVEIDGASHEGREPYDEWRDQVLFSWGIRVLRFTEADAQHRPEWVIARIREAVEDG